MENNSGFLCGSGFGLTLGMSGFTASDDFLHFDSDSANVVHLTGEMPTDMPKDEVLQDSKCPTGGPEVCACCGDCGLPPNHGGGGSNPCCTCRKNCEE